MAPELLPWIVAGASLVVAFLVAHGLGLLFSGLLRVHPGRIREWMPTIPGHVSESGRPERRWERSRARVEGRVLRLLSGGATAVHAADIAGRLGEHPAVVEDVLGHIREAVPCRLRVTASGVLLHDFAAEDIGRLRSRRALALPLRLLLFVLGLGANAGAAWPVVVTAAVAAITLTSMAMTTSEDEALVVGVAGVLGLIALVFGTVVAGFAIRLALWPWMTSPRLGDTIRNETPSLDERDPLLAMIFPGPAVAPMKLGSAPAKKSRSWGLSNLDLGSFDDPRGCLIAIVVILLLAVLALATFALYLWVRGIWRAVKRLGEADPIHSPAAWIRATPPTDWIERLIPTNDLVLRITRVLRRLLGRTHPRDGAMPRRILARARAQGGRVAALEVALMEALDLDEATAVCARLSGMLDGDIIVTDGGELDFKLPDEALSTVSGGSVDEVQAEFVAIDRRRGFGGRRPSQRPSALPVNLPGLTSGHLGATDRFVAGTVMMMMCAIAALQLMAMPSWATLAASGALAAATVSAFVLAALARYTSRASAIHGIKRDARRAGVAAIERALRAGSDSVDMSEVERQLEHAFAPCWSSLPVAMVDRELDGVCVDFDLDPHVDDTSGGTTYSVKELAARFEEIHASRSQPTLPAGPPHPDEVVFDSQVDRQRVRVLV